MSIGKVFSSVLFSEEASTLVCVAKPAHDTFILALLCIRGKKHEAVLYMTSEVAKKCGIKVVLRFLLVVIAASLWLYELSMSNQS